jgi:hypothetical protein
MERGVKSGRREKRTEMIFLGQVRSGESSNSTAFKTSTFLPSRNPHHYVHTPSTNELLPLAPALANLVFAHGGGSIAADTTVHIILSAFSAGASSMWRRDFDMWQFPARHPEMAPCLLLNKEARAVSIGRNSGTPENRSKKYRTLLRCQVNHGILRSMEAAFRLLG